MSDRPLPVIMSPFDAIIDAILDANPEAVREHQQRRKDRKARATNKDNGKS